MGNTYDIAERRVLPPSNTYNQFEKTFTPFTINYACLDDSINNPTNKKINWDYIVGPDIQNYDAPRPYIYIECLQYNDGMKVMIVTDGCNYSALQISNGIQKTLQSGSR